MRAAFVALIVALCAFAVSADPLQRKTAAAAVPCVPNTLVIVTDDATIGDCAGGGSTASLCSCDDDGLGISAAGDGGGGAAGIQSPMEDNYTIFNIADYGAIADDATNDTAAIELAFEACDATTQGLVYFPAGTWLIHDDDADNVGMKIAATQFCPMYGAGMAWTSVNWNTASASGDVMFEVDQSDPGAVYWKAHDMSFNVNGAGNRPGTFLKMTDSVGTQSTDIGNRMWNLQFSGNAGGAGLWLSKGVVNFYAAGMRFDPNSAGWGLRVDVDALTAQGFVMRDFTVDTTLSGATGGFAQFVSDGMAYTGVYLFEGGRIEAGGGWAGSVFEQEAADSPSPNGLVLAINAVNFDIGAGGCVFSNEDTTTPTPDASVNADDGYDIRLTNSSVNSASAMLCGEWGSNVTTPGDKNWGPRSAWFVNRATAPNTTEILCADSGTDCIRWSIGKACLYYDHDADGLCDSGEELSTNCTTCDGTD